MIRNPPVESTYIHKIQYFDALIVITNVKEHHDSQLSFVLNLFAGFSCTVKCWKLVYLEILKLV